MASQQCSTPKNRQIAYEILKKITKLKVGQDAPGFTLYTLSGKTKRLEDFKGKFVYLNFANTKNYACKKDFQVLEQVRQLFKRDMVIVTVLTDEDPDMAQEYIKNNKLKWTFLHFNQNAKVLFDYDVKAYPTYYLINPEGKLVLSPSPAPEENFMSVFSEMYNAYRYKKLRKERPRSRTIYDL
jgi:peroxiredoxin